MKIIATVFHKYVGHQIDRIVSESKDVNAFMRDNGMGKFEAATGREASQFIGRCEDMGGNNVSLELAQ